MFLTSRMHHDDQQRLLTNVDIDQPSTSSTIELRARNAPSRTYRDEVDDTKPMIEYTVQPDDTMQKLSVKFRVKISELQRINKMWRDQDLHGMKTIRVPVSRYAQHVPTGHLLDVDGSEDAVESTVEVGSSDGESAVNKLGKIMAKVDQTVTNTQEALTQRQNEMESFGGGGEEMHFYEAMRPPTSLLEREAPCILFLVIMIFLVLPTIAIVYKTITAEHHGGLDKNSTTM